MARSKGYRRRTRALLKKRSSHGLSHLLKEYTPDQKVVIKIDSTQVKGMPHRRFNGLVGVVKETGRRAVTIDVNVGGKVKTVISRKEHIVPHGEAK
jgi:large subunit ribosomal protein L21e